MTTSLTIFILSVVASLVLLLNKHRESVYGKPYIAVGTDSTDYAIRRYVDMCMQFARLLRVETIQKHAHRFAVMIERSVLNIMHRLSTRFAIFGDIVTGRDIPKNRGSISFFLKNIEDEKNKNIKSF